MPADLPAAIEVAANLVQDRKRRAQGSRILAEQDDCSESVIESFTAEIRQWQDAEDAIRAIFAAHLEMGNVLDDLRAAAALVDRAHYIITCGPGEDTRKVWVRDAELFRDVTMRSIR